MNMDNQVDLQGLTEKVIGCVFKVHNELGPGFLEKVYERALFYELNKNDIAVESQKQINVYYENQVVGEFYADLLIEGNLILEIKAVKKLVPEFTAQVLNYLKASNKNIALLINFGSGRAEIKRLVL